MRLRVLSILLPGLLVLATASGFTSGRPPRWEPSDTGVTARLRGLSVVSARVAWASGSGGTVLRTVDSGRTWQLVGPPGTADLQFRDIEAFSADRAVALSIGEGEASRIYATSDGGRTWTESFRNDEPRAFYDCLAFFDHRRGLALSDPVDGRFRIAATVDGGRSWRVLSGSDMPAALDGSGYRMPPALDGSGYRMPPALDGSGYRMPATPDGSGYRMPPALDGEFAFAASGTCLVTADRGGPWAWFATGGGATARVFASHDFGRTWRVFGTPVPSGASAGIYSLAFRDPGHGIAVGGDFAAPASAPDGAAVSRDAGRTWTVAGTVPGEYRSGAAWLPRAARTAVAVGPTGSDVTYDGGRTWTRFDTGSYDSVDCAPDGTCWASGEQGRTAHLHP